MAENIESKLREILWDSLRGGDYNLDTLEQELAPTSNFEEAGIDSLDMTDFFLRVEDRFKIKIRQEEYPDLFSLNQVVAYLEHTASAVAAGE